MADVAVALREVTVAYGETVVLGDLTLDVGVGETVGLVGENGAGKSTLLNVLSGLVVPRSGSLQRPGAPTEITTPADALAAGIHRVHQEQALISQLTVAENLVLSVPGAFANPMGVVRRKQLHAFAAEVLTSLRLDYEPSALLATYNFGARQMIELARVVAQIRLLGHRQPVVLLDEPTAALAASELEAFDHYVDVLRTTYQASIVLVSHRLEEVIRLSDRLVVLKDGVLVGQAEPDVSESALHRMMVGRERAADFYGESRQRLEFGEPRLEVKDLSIGPLKGLDLVVRSGEIVGLAGLPRSGKHEVLQALAGTRPYSSSQGLLDGQALPATTSARVRRGLGFIPLDRSSEGIASGLSISENVVLASHADWSKHGVIADQRVRDTANGIVKSLGVRCRSIKQSVGSLSGGNQQKVVFGRWLVRDISVLVADNPTRGVDAGAKEDLYGVLRQLADRGTAVVLVSDDLPELIGLSNRIFVLRDGAVTAEVDAHPQSKPHEHDIVAHMV